MIAAIGDLAAFERQDRQVALSTQVTEVAAPARARPPARPPAPFRRHGKIECS
jgi:hypothetical protein